MKKALYIILSLLVLACSKDDEGSIIGMASANDGEVVSGITVKLYSDKAQFVTETTTDNEGNFAFGSLEVGNYFIVATTTISGETWDTTNAPQMIYVGGEIEKEISLTLTKK